MTEVTITEKETIYLHAIAHSEYGDQLGDSVWTDCIWHGMGTSAPGVAGSLHKKGLIATMDYEPGKPVTWLTPAGIAVVKKHGLAPAYRM